MLSTMELDKFRGSTTGKAFLERCVRIPLLSPSAEDLLKQALRIRRGESLTFLSKSNAQTLSENCESSMRTLANLMEGLKAEYAGSELRELPTDELLLSVTGTLNDDQYVAKFVEAVLDGKFSLAQKSLLEATTDGVSLIQKIGYMVNYLVSTAVMKGGFVKGIWATASGKELYKKLVDAGDMNETLSKLAEMNSRLVTLRISAGAFVVDERHALSAFAWQVIQANKG
jgi:hypothetical protein